MSEIIDNDDGLEIPDELSTLKTRADMMGITYHPNIGVEKLRDKITAAIEHTAGPVSDDVPPIPELPVAQVEETTMQRKLRKRKEATELVRIRVTCMNPAKKEWEGEIFTAGNSLVGSFSKFVPFNNDEGWHVPRIILNQITERQCQTFVAVRDARGNTTRKGKLIREFAVEILPNLTPAELKDLAQRQAMAKAVD